MMTYQYPEIRLTSNIRPTLVLLVQIRLRSRHDEISPPPLLCSTTADRRWMDTSATALILHISRIRTGLRRIRLSKIAPSLRLRPPSNLQPPPHETKTIDQAGNRRCRQGTCRSTLYSARGCVRGRYRELLPTRSSTGAHMRYREILEGPVVADPIRPALLADRLTGQTGCHES